MVDTGACPTPPCSPSPLPLRSNRRTLDRHHRPRDQLNKALAEPSLYDDVLSYLNRNGFGVPVAVLDREFSVPYEPSKAVEKDMGGSVVQMPFSKPQVRA